VINLPWLSMTASTSNTRENDPPAMLYRAPVVRPSIQVQGKSRTAWLIGIFIQDSDLLLSGMFHSGRKNHFLI
jgi:hypothetical protein